MVGGNKRVKTDRKWPLSGHPECLSNKDERKRPLAMTQYLALTLGGCYVLAEVISVME